MIVAVIRSNLFQLAVETAECWSCHKQARVVAVIAPADAMAIDDEEDSAEPMMVNEAAVLMNVQRMSPELAAAVRVSAPTFHPDFSKTTGASYWMNHCQHCDALMGDHFLHMEPDGPFMGWPRAPSSTGVTLDLVGGDIACGSMPYIEEPSPRRRRAKQ